uniref:VWFA domain-containing protein n=1 Tax=Branchiostoma floridae TaxID=7739 RepID=C3XSR3_BRAFL|eukprot:XP_002612975.1 hypothetical protein BRAFLDRAFT_74759 [Branchiostoma floridae]
MLLLLLLAAACIATNGQNVTLCERGSWQECEPNSDKPGVFRLRTYGTFTCVMCAVLSRGDTPTRPFQYIAKVDDVAIRGYPFHVLSAMKLAQLEHSKFHRSLALIDAKITDVENNTFAGFSRLSILSLDSNRLTHVKQVWFTGLERLMALVLSNNNIKQIEPGSFMHFTYLIGLDLENNLLQVVDPSWIFGLHGSFLLDLSSNAINSISPASFQDLLINWLDLSGNDLSCLDGEVLERQTSLMNLHVSSCMLSSVHDAKPHSMIWSLHRLASYLRGTATMVVEVPKFLFCARYTEYDLSFGWMFDTSEVRGHIQVGGVNPGMSCGELDNYLSTISIQAPVVVLATDGSLEDETVSNRLEQCRQVWEYDGGITVGLTGNIIFQLVSLATGHTAFEGAAMSFVQTKDADTFTTTEYSDLTNATHDNTKNITCILLTKGEHTELFFTVPPAHTHTTATTYRTATTYSTDTTDHSSRQTHYSEIAEMDFTSSRPGDISTLQMSTTPGLEVSLTTDHILISVVVSAVASVVVASLVVLVWKLRSTRLNAEDGSVSDDAHIWIIPPGVAFPGLMRSASLPACSGNTESDDIASCRSLPAVLHSVEPTYSEIPDDIATAQRPLPGLPHTYWEIPDNISGVVRSASLPACTLGRMPDDGASCSSLPAVLQPIDPNYSEIPDDIAVAQRPLPTLPRTSWEISDHGAAAQLPMPVSRHTYSEIPDDEDSGPMPFYDNASEFSLHVVTNRRQNRRAFRNCTTASSRQRPGRSIAAYGLNDDTKTQSNNIYRNAPEVQGIKARRRLRTALVSQATDQGLRTYVNVTDAILSSGQNVTEAHIAFLTFPNAYLPWEITGEDTRITPRRASLPLVTLPNTYWPWDIPGDGTGMRPRGASLPLVTLPNTYWPWEIPAEGTSNTPRRAPLPFTLPNIYCTMGTQGEGTRDTPRRASLPLVTLPNTYWPWEIPGDGTGMRPRGSSLPLVTLPNTYWPWQIPAEGTGNTTRRASLPFT